MRIDSTIAPTVRLHTYGKHSGWWEFRDAIAARKNFTTSGSFYGRVLDPASEAPGSYPTGILPDAWKVRFQADPFIDYCVWSYDTPIAWHSELTGGWTVPDVKYSLTTTKHQTIVRVAVGELS